MVRSVPSPASVQYMDLMPNGAAMDRQILNGAVSPAGIVSSPSLSPRDAISAGIRTAIFNGYGFELFGKLQRYQLYGIVLGVWLVILIVSPIWLRHFRFGPLEWMWRSLTCWKRQPFRIRDRAIA